MFLGSKFWRNSGQILVLGHFPGIWVPESPESFFYISLFSGILQSDVFSKGLFYKTPPLQTVPRPMGEGLSIVFSLRDSWSRRYQQSWTWSTSNWTKTSGVFCRNIKLCRNAFQFPVDFGPWTGRNFSGILNLDQNHGRPPPQHPRTTSTVTSMSHLRLLN
jgi:hypothetical protein